MSLSGKTVPYELYILCKLKKQFILRVPQLGNQTYKSNYERKQYGKGQLIAAPSPTKTGGIDLGIIYDVKATEAVVRIVSRHIPGRFSFYDTYDYADIFCVLEPIAA